MATDPVPAPRKLAHIHLGVDGGAEKFFVRLSRALAKRGVEQMAFIRHDRPWRDELAAHCDVRELKFSRSHFKRHFVRWGIARDIRNFGAKTTLGWMSPASKWLPKPGPDMRTFLRLGDFPDGFHTYGNVQHLIGNTPEIIRQAVEAGWPAERAHMISNFVDPLPQGLEPVNRAEFNTPEDVTVLIALGASFLWHPCQGIMRHCCAKQWSAFCLMPMCMSPIGTMPAISPSARGNSISKTTLFT